MDSIDAAHLVAPALLFRGEAGVVIIVRRVVLDVARGEVCVATAGSDWSSRIRRVSG